MSKKRGRPSISAESRLAGWAFDAQIEVENIRRMSKVKKHIQVRLPWAAVAGLAVATGTAGCVLSSVDVLRALAGMSALVAMAAQLVELGREEELKLRPGTKDATELLQLKALEAKAVARVATIFTAAGGGTLVAMQAWPHLSPAGSLAVFTGLLILPLLLVLLTLGHRRWVVGLAALLIVVQLVSWPAVEVLRRL